VVSRRVFIAGLSAAAVAPAACSTTSPTPASSSAAHTSHPKPSSSATSSPDITLAFAGDVNFEDRTATLLKDPATAFGPISAVLQEADFTALNLETSVTSRGTPQPKTFHFRTTPAAFTAIRAAGVNLVTMANNHVEDYGETGLADTLAAAKASGLPYVGIGADADAAWAPHVATIKGTKVAFIGVSQVAQLASSWVATNSRPGEANAINLHRTLNAIRAAKRLASIVVVFMHWGTEGQSSPDANQLALAPQLAAAGATIIVGSHAHMLQGSGWLRNTFVAYGMGNFLWWENSYSTATGVLHLTLHPNRPLTARFIPAVVSDTGQPIRLTGGAARQAQRYYASLRSSAQLASAPY
jgi:poly-gamma-glutamate capsule biosynthesis protein CapA/YwtB (metallophosphatase superfamily)